MCLPDRRSRPELAANSERARGALRAARASKLRGFVALTTEPLLEYQLEQAQRAASAAERSGTGSSRLAGAALVVKDNIHVRGLPNTAATSSMREFAPEADAPAVGRLRARGMIMLGKANMHELAIGVTSAFSAAGPVENAVAPGRVAGGSSGGTAAVVGAGICAYGLGTDTGGSVRIPAAFNDVWGFRPSTGRYDRGGITSISTSRDTVGPMAANLCALATLDRELAGLTPEMEAQRNTSDSRFGLAHKCLPVRLGFDPSDMVECDPLVASGFRHLLEALEAAPELELVPLSLRYLDVRASELEPRLANHELVPSLQSYLAGYPGLPSLAQLADAVQDPFVASLIDDSLATARGSRQADRDYDVRVASTGVRAGFVALFRRHGLTAVLRPTVPMAPPPSAEAMGLSLEARSRQFSETTRFVRLAPLVGGPSLTLPLGQLTGWNTVGALLDGLPGDDAYVVATASLIQCVLKRTQL